MNNWSSIPAVLLRKLILTAIIGPTCFIFGAIYYFCTHDRIFFCISLIVMAACLIKAAILFLTVRKNEYDELNGVCVRVTSKAFSKYKRIRLLDDNLVETEIMLKKESKIAIGNRYRFYMKKRPDSGLPIDNEYVASFLNGDNVLGYEDLGAG